MNQIDRLFNIKFIKSTKPTGSEAQTGLETPATSSKLVDLPSVECTVASCQTDAAVLVSKGSQASLGPALPLHASMGRALAGLRVETQGSLSVSAASSQRNMLQVIQTQDDLGISPKKTKHSMSTPQQNSLNLESSKDDDEDYQRFFESETKTEVSVSELGKSKNHPSMLKKHYRSGFHGTEDAMMTSINEILKQKDDDICEVPLKLQIADKFAQISKLL